MRLVAAVIGVLVIGSLGACRSHNPATTSNGAVEETTTTMAERPIEPTWADETYSLDCGAGQPRMVTLLDGQFEQSEYEKIELGDVFHIDLDHDGTDEVLVRLVCDYGARSHDEHVILYDERAGTYQRIGSSVSGQKVRRDGERFIVTDPDLSDGSPPCCPNAYRETVYEFSSDGFGPVDRANEEIATRTRAPSAADLAASEARSTPNTLEPADALAVVQAVAGTLHSAWVAGDRKAALTFLTSDPADRLDVLEQLFGSSLDAGAFYLDDCEDVSAYYEWTHTCVFKGTIEPPDAFKDEPWGTTELHMHLTPRSDGGFVVTSVTPMPSEH